MSYYDFTVVVRAYECGQTIEACLESIFMQQLNRHSVLLIVYYIRSNDDTFDRIIAIEADCPDEIEYRMFVAPGNGDVQSVPGFDEVRSYFEHDLIRGDAIFLIDAGDVLIERDVLVSQVGVVREFDCLSYCAWEPGGPATPALGDVPLFSGVCLPVEWYIRDARSTPCRYMDWYATSLIHFDGEICRTGVGMIRRGEAAVDIAYDEVVRDALSTSLSGLRIGRVGIMVMARLSWHVMKLLIRKLCHFKTH